MSKIKMDRVNYLENQLSGCLENLDAFSVQLTVIQDFLQKQFGSRFVDYAINRGVFIEKPTSNRTAASSSYYTKTSSSKPIPSTTSQNYEIGEEDYAYEAQVEDSSDPLAFVEIIDDSEDRHQREVDEYDEGDGDEDYLGMNEQENLEAGNQDYYDEDDQTGQDDLGDNSLDSRNDPGLVIVNCVSEKNVKREQSIRLPSPPPITARPPAARTYIKPNLNPAQQTEAPKQRLPSNFLAGRKRPAASTSSGETSLHSCPLPKMPLLHPQITQTQPQISLVSQDEYDNLMEFSDRLDLNILDTTPDIKVDQEGSEDLREYYDVLPDKSVQCKICDKVLKAGWHKYGRHYRTHTGEKPYSCPICGENFARKDNMANHVKSKHENKRQRPSENENADDDGEYKFTPMFYLPSELC